MPRRVIAILALLSMATPLAGCGSGDRTDPGRAGPGVVDPASSGTGPAVLGTASSGAGPTLGTEPGPPAGPAATCPTTSTTRPLTELQGVADAGESLWALLFPRGGNGLTAGQEEKIVWRMTGSGTFSVRATGPDGVTVDPVWGPTGHGGSSWSRPGDEWGTGWTFPTAGCWTVRASRSGGATGSLALPIG